MFKGLAIFRVCQPIPRRQLREMKVVFANDFEVPQNKNEHRHISDHDLTALVESPEAEQRDG